ncbi:MULTISPECIES: putative acetyltransferase [Frankia]|uniref:putative acetyltransferase n=1 Tax=Frankia sp. CcI6 TaxID=1352929 RepID=UPI000427CAA3
MVYVVRITPADVGARVMLRHRIPGPVSLSDVLGTLRSWSSGVLTVVTAEGTLVQVTEDAVVAARVIPPRPPTRRTRNVPDTTALMEIVPNTTTLNTTTPKATIAGATVLGTTVPDTPDPDTPDPKVPGLKAAAPPGAAAPETAAPGVNAPSELS